MEENNKQQIKGLLYEEEKINRIFALLNTILVSTRPQIKSMNSIFDILENPIPFKPFDEADIE